MCAPLKWLWACISRYLTSRAVAYSATDSTNPAVCTRTHICVSGTVGILPTVVTVPLAAGQGCAVNQPPRRQRRANRRLRTVGASVGPVCLGSAGQLESVRPRGHIVAVAVNWPPTGCRRPRRPPGACCRSYSGPPAMGSWPHHLRSPADGLSRPTPGQAGAAELPRLMTVNSGGRAVVSPCSACVELRDLARGSRQLAPCREEFGGRSPWRSAT